MEEFFGRIAANSAKIPAKEGEDAAEVDSNRRVLDFFDINILKERNPPPSNLSPEKIPSRIVISFLNDIDVNRLVDLSTEVKTAPGFSDIFIDDNIKLYKPNPYSLKGHLKDDSVKGVVYVPHKRQKDTRKKNNGEQRQRGSNFQKKIPVK